MPEEQTQTNQKPIRVGDKVKLLTEDKPLTGKVQTVYKKEGVPFYSVKFSMGSPFIDDWAIFRANEVQLAE